MTTAAGKQWVFTFDGQVFREADLSIDDVEIIERASGTTWLQINPVRSAVHGRAVLEMFLVTRLGMAQDAAHKKVGALKVNEFLDLISYEEEDADLPVQYEEGFPPKADEPSTPT